MTRLKSAVAFAIAIDESTDIALEKHCVIYVKYVYRGKARVEFLGILNLTSGGGAESIMSALLEFLEDKGLDLDKFLAFGSDGCSVMLGKDTGVVTRLKRAVQPMMVAIHCICHRLQLGCVDASKKINFAGKWEKVLNHIYSHFSRSTEKSDAWREIAQNLTGRWSKLVHSCKTRWLSRDGCVTSIQKQLPSLIKYFDTVSAPPAQSGDADDDKIKIANLLEIKIQCGEFHWCFEFLCGHFQCVCFNLQILAT